MTVHVRRCGRAVTLAVVAALLASAPASGHAADTPSVVRYRVRPGAEIDLGWTGLSHHQPWPADQQLVFALGCGDDPSASCAVSGGAPGDFFGAPIPLSSGGVSACVVLRLRAPLGGAIDPGTGCGELRLQLTATVWLASDIGRPCALCEGDPRAHDGRKQGRCSDGARAGKPCDAASTSARFGGATSQDCPAPGAVVGELPLDSGPLTTGKVARAADQPCRSKRLPGACYCPGQVQSTDCLTGACPHDERCETGPYDGVCDGQPFRSCALGSGTTECEDKAAGAGRCMTVVRSCFSDVIAAEGTCSPTAPTFVGVFCLPATRAPSLNTVAGLPGPARLQLPLERLP